MKRVIFISVLILLVILLSCQKQNKEETEEVGQVQEKVVEKKQVKGEEEPTELEIKVYNRLHYLLNKKEGNPYFEVTPTNLSKEQYGKWKKDWMKRVEEYDKKQYEIIAREFKITAEEAEKIYEKVTIIMIEKKSK